MQESNFRRSCRRLRRIFDIDPALMRLLFVISVIPGGLGVIIYLASWLIIPNDPECESIKKPEEEIKEAAEDLANQTRKNFKDAKHGDGKAIIGSIIVVIGALLLIRNLTGINVWENFWPIALIIVGFVILWKGTEGKGK